MSIPLPEIKGRSGGCLGIRKKLKEKLKEALQAVLPIIGLVLLPSFTIAPISPSILLCFLIGGILLIAGIVFFTLGAELAMSPMGERVGTAMTQSKKLWVVVALSFLLGFIITISEPDLQVLAQQVPAVPNLTLILAVACGVGVSCGGASPYAGQHRAAPFACLLLCGDFYSRVFCSQRIFERSVRFRRCDHGTDDGAVYYGAGRWYFCNAKRPPCSG